MFTRKTDIYVTMYIVSREIEVIKVNENICYRKIYVLYTTALSIFLRNLEVYCYQNVEYAAK